MATMVVLPGAAHAAANNVGSTITFDLPDGTDVTNQYQSYGVVFDGNGDADPFTVDDGSASTNPVLSGQPRYQGDVAGTVVDPVSGIPTTSYGVTLDVGFIDNPGSVEVIAYDAHNNVLTTIQANADGFNHLTLSVRGMARFLVHSIGVEDNGWEIDNVRIQPSAEGTKPVRMASIGDSYSSGEGLVPQTGAHYDCGTDLHAGTYYENTTLGYKSTWINGLACDIPTGSTAPPTNYFNRAPKDYLNLCHRNARAYPNQIRQGLGVSGSNAMFAACSGAVTANIGATSDATKQYPQSPSNVYGGNLQLTDLANFAKSGAPDLLTVGIGGNDAGFAPVIAHCVTSDCIGDYTDAVISKVLDDVYPRLLTTFRKLRSTYPNATIAAFGYTTPVASSASCAGVLGLSSEELDWLTGTFLPFLNQSISDAAATAGLTYIDLSHTLDGHGICSSQPWANGLRLGDDKFSVLANESFHPNQYGHDAEAAYFMQHYTDGHGRLTFTNPTPATANRPPNPYESTIHIGTVNGAVSSPCGQNCVQPSVCASSCAISLQGGGFDPNTTLTVVAHSDPVTLGTVQTDADGNLATVLHVPAAELPPGQHVISLQGTTAVDGVTQQDVADQLIDVLPSTVPLPVTSPSACLTSSTGVLVRGLQTANLRESLGQKAVVLRSGQTVVAGSAPLVSNDDGSFNADVTLTASSGRLLRPGAFTLSLASTNRTDVPAQQRLSVALCPGAHLATTHSDFNGDGKSDFAVFRPANGTWYVKGIATAGWGRKGDIPVAADFNGDGKADLAVFRPSNGTWYVKGAANVQWGRSGDTPMAADFNGDGKTDYAVFRPSNGTWYVKGAANVQWGKSGDIPLAADFNGDGKTDYAVFRPSNGAWYVKGGGTVQWGHPGDIPIAADFNGDGKADRAVFRPSNNTWYVRGIAILQYGGRGDIPLAADFNGDGKTDYAVFRPSTGTWYAKGIATVQYGRAGDIPLSKSR